MPKDVVLLIRYQQTYYIKASILFVREGSFVNWQQNFTVSYRWKLKDKGRLVFAILIVTLVWISNYNLALENIKYIVNNYEIDTSSDNFLNIRTILAAPILTEEIFSNAIKLEYQLNFQGIKENINPSMLFNTDEYWNILRNWWQRDIDRNIWIYEESSPSIFTREYIYYTFLWKDFISFRWYYEELEKINAIKKEILELIK